MNSSLIALLAGALTGCAVVPDGMLSYREPTAATFGEPVSLSAVPPNSTLTPARELYPYAALSVNVYNPATSGNASIERSPQRLELACSKGSAEPLPIGPRWLLQDFPPDANELDDTYNLRLQLWGRLGANGDKISELVLAFRGTEARHGEDWWANLRWFLGPRVDHYTLTSDTVAPALQTWIEAKITAGVVAPDVKLVTTGHSLGGGLAQRMAYAFLTPNGRALRVHHVYAFDPSPVTGWFSVEKDLRERNVDGMQIDRILEDGEALSYVRTLLGIVVRPTEKNPAIRGVKFNFKHSYNPLSNHSMRLIGCSLAKYAFPSSNALDTQPLEQEQD